MSSPRHANVAQEDILIAVMGPTGTGKSTFVNLVSQSNKMSVGHGLHSHTTHVQSSDAVELMGHRVTLLDTPGFNDTNVSEVDVLKQIALFLQITLEQGFLLSGVIYIHSISTNRMGGSSLKNLAMFRELCGNAALKNVVLVTNMWEDVSPTVAERRERELRNGKTFYKPLISRGASLLRHNNTLESAIKILGHLIGNRPLPLQIQKELVEQGLQVIETSAAKCLNRLLKGEARRQYEGQIQEARKSIGSLLDSRHAERGDRAETLRREYSAKLTAVEEDERRMARQYLEEKKASDEKIAKATKELKELRQAQEKREQEIVQLEEQLKRGDRLDAKDRRRLKKRIAELKKESGSNAVIVQTTICVLALVLDIVLLTTTGVPVPVFSIVNRLLSSLDSN